ncbi:molybdopterin-binding protein [Desulfomicrobium escambiense]|uniref:molybdopterin-binding protein n=1 Tax=Desulfomicrobium escambiense TaxID=29503 RepID=UPI0003F81BCE|nr:molybdopterin-binding protein [Desulfomicrobium escambiense]
MKAIPVEEAVGTVLCHDITRIIPGETKGAAFRRGHIVTPQDIQALLDIGKANLYVFDPRDGYVHEDECALRLAHAAAGQGITVSSPCEGKSALTATHDGVLHVDVEGLFRLNSITDVTFGTIHTGQCVKAGRVLGGTRVIPLAVPEDLLRQAEDVCRQYAPLIEVRPLKPARVGVVTTGSEVYTGRIKDGFGPVLRRKFEHLGSTVLDQVFVSDKVEMTVAAIRDLVARGADFIAVTGGMSVDPDDQTPAAIRATGAEVVSYGAPTYPGAMFMLAYLGDVPIVGLPGCVMYYKASIFDLVVPRLLSGERLERKDIVAFGHGGLCESCPTCHYPACGFGKL